MRIQRYDDALRDCWDQFIRNSRNGTFLFERGYMDYHADRFADHSLMFFRQDKLLAVLPANYAGRTLYSHQGLTYGGLILSDMTCATEIGSMFDLLVAYLKEAAFESLVYKPVPYFYWKQPSAEDLYFLFRKGARKISCSLGSTIDLHERLPYGNERKRALRRASKSDLVIRETRSLNDFWSLMEENLQSRYGVGPVHSVEEMSLLQTRFPEQIRLFGAYEQDRIVAGVLFFDTGKVIRIQYPHSSDRGKEVGAMDLLFDHLIEHFSTSRDFFDFGQSTEENGHYLNAGLIHYKEGLGGRGTLYEVYQLDL